VITARFEGGDPEDASVVGRAALGELGRTPVPINQNGVVLDSDTVFVANLAGQNPESAQMKLGDKAGAGVEDNWGALPVQFLLAETGGRVVRLLGCHEKRPCRKAREDKAARGVGVNAI
jgi:hypothetical protein